MSESIQIYLNSQYASIYNNGLYNSDCDYVLPTIEIPNDYQIYLSVQSAMIPYSFYNIDSSNNYLVFKYYGINNYSSESGYISEACITIPTGNYNAIQLSSYITNQGFGISMVGISDVVVSFNIITNKFEFKSVLYAFMFNFHLSTSLALLGFPKYISKDITPTQSYKSITTGTTAFLTSTTQINLSPKKYLYIGTNLQTGNILTTGVATSNKNNSKNILCAIPITGAPYSTISYINYNNFSVNLYNNILSTINIKILDQDGMPINFNNQFYSLTLQLDIVNFIS